MANAQVSGQVSAWARARCTLEGMNHRTGRIVATVISAVALLGASACTGGKNAVDQSAGGQFRYVQATGKGQVIDATKRKLAGPVKGELLSGGSYSLAADKGKVVVLNFLASWCGPCQIETPQFDALYRQRRAAGVQFVGLDVKDPSKGASQSWVRDLDITFPVVYDEPAKTAQQLGNVPVLGLPATVIVDKHGRVAAVYPVKVAPADLSPVLDMLLKES
jgi:peroxiredoxin